MKSAFRFLAIIILLFTGVITYAGNTGGIRGIVLDDATGNPIMDVKITIKELDISQATDERGEYFFSGLSVDFYTLRVEHAKYGIQERENVIVTADSVSTESPIRLKKGIASKTIIKVVDKRVVKIQRSKGATEHNISAQEMENVPVGSMFAMAQTVPGVIGDGKQLHIRGGRDDEVNYMVDGMTIRDPITGTFGGNLNMNSIKEMTVKTGGYSAEYGGALSGIINVVTKEGGKKYSGSLSYYTGELVWKNANMGDKDLNWQLGGPISIFKQKRGYPFLSFYTSGSQFIGDYKWRADPKYSDPDYPISFDKEYSTGFLNWDWRNYIDTASKLTLKINPKIKIKFGFQYSVADINYRTEKYNTTPTAEHQPTQHQTNNQLNLEWAHRLSGNLFYQIFLYRFQNGLSVKVHDKELSEYEFEYDPYSWDYPVYADRTSTQYTVKIDAVNQINRIHQIKTGLAYSYYDLRSFNVYYPGADWESTDIYHRYVDEQAFYVRDYMDWDQDLVMNIGVRYDRRQYSVSQFSPRGFVSFAITDRAKFRFTYGIFYQAPPMMYILQEKYESYKDQSNNQYLNPENAVSYEYGITYLLSDVLKLDLVTYYKNTSDLVKYVAGNSRLSGSDRPMPMNVDHSYAQGFELQLTKGFSNHYYWRLAYTLSDAKGTSSDPFVSIDVLPPKEFPLDWDITHNLTFQFGYESASYGASLIGYFHTGKPYTSVDGGKKGLTNDARYPLYKRIDGTVWKYFNNVKWFGLKYKIYLEITNIFDTKNVTDVWEDGSAKFYSTPARAKAGVDISF
jgi:outer membrane receptor for ferrienterochelin and colicin